MITFDSYFNGDDEISSFMDEVNSIVRKESERLANCEQKLEQFIESELIDILVDERRVDRLQQSGRSQLIDAADIGR